MDLGLQGKRALITGASKGIGRAVAEALAAEGCDLVLVARSADVLDATAEAIRARANVSVETCPADLATGDGQSRVADTFADVDILVNNAGANPAGEIDQIDDAAWRAAWDLKLFGYINLSRAFYAAMKARGAGVIVNVIGAAGERANATYILGSAGNIALMGLTRALGARAPDFGVRVVGVNPGLTATARAEGLLKSWSEQKFGTPDRADDVLADMNLPFGRMARPAEIADLVAFLASPRAGYISGTIVTVDGGGVHRNH